MFASGDPVADACAGERQPDARMTEGVEPAFPAAEDGDHQPDRSRHQDVSEDDEVGQDRADGNDQGQRVKCTKKRPGDKLPGGEEG